MKPTRGRWAGGILRRHGICAHVPNENRIAFWVESVAELDRLAGVAEGAGALHFEAPAWEDDHTYYAAFFEDPCGNRLELCHRTAPVRLQP
jgi:catechol 2,3-dioxygenase-like lactoylglutathione lyase family enzyme